MAEIGNVITKDALVNYLKSLGIDVHLNTKARGHSGFCTGKRIDVSKNLSDEKVIEVLLHEFAHFIHFKMEPDIIKTHGSIEKLFNTDNTEEIAKELYQITLLVFDNTPVRKMMTMKEKLNIEIKKERDIIKTEYPNFQASKKFKEFEKYIKHSDAKYLLRYDRVLIKGNWFFQDKKLSIKNIDRDFPDMPRTFLSYIKMKSFERRRNRINSRISKINKYLMQPTELFARFFEMLYTDEEAVKNFAPKAYNRFCCLKAEEYYPYLNNELFQ